MKNKKFKNVVKVISVVIIIIGILIIKSGYEYKENIVPVYNYSAQKDSNYEVLLNPNTFYESQNLPQGLYYASKSIKSFMINMIYDFKADKKAQIEYNYNITANLIGNVNDNNNQSKEIWNRNFVLSEKNDVQETDIIYVDEGINIDYEYYNELVNSYEETYDIKIDAILKVRFNISYNISNLESGIDIDNIEDYIELDIPITNTVTGVTENYEHLTSKNIMPSIQKENIKIIFYIIGAVLIISGIVMIIMMKNKKSPEEKYNYNIAHILKYYGDLIVTVINKPNLDGLKVLNINNLKDLVDVAEQNQNNIIHYEVIENTESDFYVIVNEYVYVYRVKSEKLK